MFWEAGPCFPPFIITNAFGCAPTTQHVSVPMQISSSLSSVSAFQCLKTLASKKKTGCNLMKIVQVWKYRMGLLCQCFYEEWTWRCTLFRPFENKVHSGWSFVTGLLNRGYFSRLEQFHYSQYHKRWQCQENELVEELYVINASVFS